MYRITTQGIGSYQDWDALLRLLVKYGRVTKCDYGESTGGKWVGHAGTLEIAIEEAGDDLQLHEVDMAREVEAWLRAPVRGIVGTNGGDPLCWIRVEALAPGEPHKCGRTVASFRLRADRFVVIYEHPTRPDNLRESGELDKYLAKIAEEEKDGALDANGRE
jgi:hypothetical protein